MILLVLSLMFASFMFGLRTLNSLFAEQKIQIRGKLIIEVAFFASWSVIGLMFASNFNFALVLCILWLGFFLTLQKISQMLQDRRFRGEIESFIDRVILHVLGGNSFRLSCLEAAKSGDAFSQQEIKRILAHVFFKQHLDQTRISSFGIFIKNELGSMDAHSHSALTRLRGLRRNLALESEFRQKSEQIKGRVLVQSIFMLGLYLAILVFVLRQAGPVDMSSLLLSVTFFVTGFAWTLLDGRKMKWKT